MVAGTRADQARMPDRIIRAVDMDLHIHRRESIPTDCNRRNFIGIYVKKLYEIRKYKYRRIQL